MSVNVQPGNNRVKTTVGKRKIMTKETEVWEIEVGEVKLLTITACTLT